MSLTITIPGAVETTTGSTAPAVLTVGVGAPGVGVPSGGTSGQVLQKLSATNYDTGWLTLPADFITSVTAPLAVASGVLSVDLSAYSTTAQAAALYYPLSGNPSAFLVAADITGKANLASPSFTGNVSITSSTGAALFIEQTGTGNILTLHDQASDTTFVTIDANGKVSTIASEATNGAGFNIAHGVGPTTPVNGDIWTSTSGLFMRQNGVTKQFVDLDTSQTISGSKTFSNATQTLGNSTATGTISVASGATISASTKTVNIGTSGVSGSTTNITVGPVLGASTTSIGNTTAASTLNLATGATLTATTKAVNVATGGVSGSTTNTTIGPVLGASTTSIGNTTAASTLNLATGATLTATTKAVNIGTAGVAGSTTNIAIGSTTGTSTTTLQGITNGTTQSPGNNTTALATTAFVTAAVPAFATVAQVVAATSTTTALAPGNQGFALTNPRLQSLAFINGAAVSGVGANATTTQTFSRQMYLASLSTGRSAYIFGAIGSANAGFGTSTAKADQVDFSKKVWISGYAMMGFSGSPSYLGDANTICRITLGGYSTNTTGDMTLKGIGLKKVGGVASTVSLTVHNGTSLTDVASSVTVPDAGGIHWQIYSDGTGNVTLYINGTQAATTTAGPTTATASGQACYREQVEAAATPGVRQVMNCNGGWFYTE